MKPGQLESNVQAPVFLFAAITAGVALVMATLVPRSALGSESIGLEGGGLLASTARMLRRPGMMGAMFVGIAVSTAVDVSIAYLPAAGAASGLSVASVGARWRRAR